MEGIGRGLFWVTTLTFIWRNKKTTKQTPIRKATARLSHIFPLSPLSYIIRVESNSFREKQTPLIYPKISVAWSKVKGVDMINTNTTKQIYFIINSFLFYESVSVPHLLVISIFFHLVIFPLIYEKELEVTDAVHWCNIIHGSNIKVFLGTTWKCKNKNITFLSEFTCCTSGGPDSKSHGITWRVLFPSNTSGLSTEYLFTKPPCHNTRYSYRVARAKP
jgi:hypothetical protein